jgi:hypothetical protein
MSNWSKAISSVGTWFLIAWFVMLLMPYVTAGAFTPGYWQVFWGMYIVATVSAFVKIWSTSSPS